MSRQLVWLCGLVVWCSTASGEQFKLDYHATARMRAEVGYVKGQGARQLPAPKQALSAQPKYGSANPVYFSAKFGAEPDNEYALVLDESKGTGKGYDTLYVDANHNLDLTDDAPVKGDCRSRGTTVYGDFPPTEIVIQYGQTSLPYQFSTRYYAYPVRTRTSSGQAETGKKRFSLYLQAACYCTGTVVLGDSSRKIALMDYNADGRFDSYFEVNRRVRTSDGKLYATGDTLRIDLNGDGRFDTNTGGPEAFGYSEQIALSGQFYHLSAAPHGRAIEIASASPKLGTLQRAGGGEFTVSLASGSGIMEFKSQDGAAAVPVGSYSLFSATMQQQDAQGQQWQLVTYGTTSTPRITVTEGRVTEAKFGHPLCPEVTSRSGRGGSVRPGSSAYLSLKISGQGGDVCSAGDITRGGRRPDPPKLKIVDRKGKTAAQGSFRYG